MRWICSVRCGDVSTIILSDLLKSRMTGARGISIIFASGDFGVGDGRTDPATQQCFTNDGRDVTKFMPVFPASYVEYSCPCDGERSDSHKQMSIVNTNFLWGSSKSWHPSPSVTSVGGTVNIPEKAVTRFASGGGFSDYVSCRWLEDYQLYDQLKKSIITSSVNLPTRKMLSTLI